jgi:hypothetical protein
VSIFAPPPKPQILGKRAPRLDARTFKLAKFLPPVIPPPPPEASWVMKVPTWPMYLNDQLGDCVIAASGHMINQWTEFATNKEAKPTNAQILKAYEDVGGYVPGDPSTDNGCVMLDALNYWRKTGIAGHKILAYASVDLTRLDEVKTAVQLFGNLYLGIQLPLTVQESNSWTVPSGGPFGDGSPGSWGGHCIPVVAYSPLTLTVITWGMRLKMSYNFLRDYADEAYCVLSSDWIAKTGLSPSQFNLTQLQADLAAL